MRALLTADQHLGKHADRLSRVPGERLAEQSALWAHVLELARENECDVILHAGDLFDARRPTPEVIQAAERPLVEHRALGGCPIVFVLGNHERNGDHPTAPGVLGLAGLIDYHERPAVVEHAGVSIVCLPSIPASRPIAAADGAERERVYEDAAEHLLDVARGYRAEISGPAILLTHFPITGDADGYGSKASGIVLPLEGLEDLGYDAVVAGDFHRPQLLESSVGRAPGPILYTGSPQPLDFAEGQYEHGVWLYGRGEAPVFLPLESRSFLTLDFDVLAEAPDDVVVALHTDIGLHAGSLIDAYVKLRYTATAEQARRIDNGTLEQALLDAGAYYAKAEPTIAREARARVQGLDETVSDEDALTLWLKTQEDVADHSALRDLHGRYLAEVAA